MDQVPRDLTVSTSPARVMSIVEAKERVHTKDWEAFERLYEYYRKPLGQRLIYLVGDREVAFDLYQGYGKDSFLRQPYEPLKRQTLLLYDADC